MFVVNISGKTLIKAVCLLLALTVAGILFPAALGAFDKEESRVIAHSKFTGIDSNEKRIEFLKSYGWETSEQAVETVLVALPHEFDDVYTEYAAIQSAQGFNLEKYKGKNLTRYTYAVTNYEGETLDTVRANILIYGTTVVGGDICSLKADGFIHGFEMPTDSPTA